MNFKYTIVFVDEDDGFFTDVELELDRPATSADIADRLAPYNIYDYPIEVELLDKTVEICHNVESQDNWEAKLQELHNMTIGDKK